MGLWPGYQQERALTATTSPHPRGRLKCRYCNWSTPGVWRDGSSDRDGGFARLHNHVSNKHVSRLAPLWVELRRLGTKLASFERAKGTIIQ